MTRGEALDLLEWFNVFMHRGRGFKPRAMSPKKALVHLQDQDVKELLGPVKCGEIRRACALLEG